MLTLQQSLSQNFRDRHQFRLSDPIYRCMYRYLWFLNHYFQWYFHNLHSHLLRYMLHLFPDYHKKCQNNQYHPGRRFHRRRRPSDKKEA